jgi:hypothetical protein
VHEMMKSNLQAYRRCNRIPVVRDVLVDKSSSLETLSTLIMSRQESFNVVI